ncbi:MAG: redoxin domain-containing protein, partial [Elusimicrobiota bacterium]
MKTSLTLLVLLALPGVSASSSAANPMRNLEIAQKAPAFALKDEHGKPRSLEDYRGSPVVLCYFRPGQPFSVKTLAALARLSKRYSAQGVTFLGLWHKDAESDAALPEVPFPLLDDGQRKFYGTYGLFILPTTAVLDKEHRLKAYFSSYHDGMEEEAAARLD